jgi:cathepsin L
MNPIRNQGNCGSCWAFATTAMIEGHFNIYNSNLKKIVLSPQHLVSCVPNPNQCGGTGGCSGATAEIAMDYLKTCGG